MSLLEALENPEAIRERKLAHRSAIWNRIKAEAPDCAEFIEMMAARYGKPEAVTVNFYSGEVLDPTAYDKKGGVD